MRTCVAQLVTRHTWRRSDHRSESRQAPLFNNQSQRGNNGCVYLRCASSPLLAGANGASPYDRATHSLSILSPISHRTFRCGLCASCCRTSRNSIVTMSSLQLNRSNCVRPSFPPTTQPERSSITPCHRGRPKLSLSTLPGGAQSFLPAQLTFISCAMFYIYPSRHNRSQPSGQFVTCYHRRQPWSKTAGPAVVAHRPAYVSFSCDIWT